MLSGGVTLKTVADEDEAKALVGQPDPAMFGWIITGYEPAYAFKVTFREQRDKRKRHQIVTPETFTEQSQAIEFAWYQARKHGYRVEREPIKVIRI